MAGTPRALLTQLSPYQLIRRRLGFIGALALAASFGAAACSDSGDDSPDPLGGRPGVEAGAGGTAEAGHLGGGGDAGGADQGGAPQGGEPSAAGSGGQDAPEPSGGQPSVDPGKPTETAVDANGGEIVVTTDSGEVTTTLTVPRGAVTESTEVNIEPADLPSSAPGSVEAVGPGFTIDFGGTTLKLPAKAKLRVAFNPADGDLVILVVTDSGTGFVKYSLQMEGGATYAVFDVVEGGRYVPVRLKNEPGCDQTLPQAVTVSTQADLEKLAKVRRIVGDLRISGSGVTSLASLKCLLQLDGGLYVDRTNVTDLEGLENLTFAGANGVYYNGYYGVQISNNALLASASLPSVIAVGTRQTNYYYEGLFLVQGNAVLESFSADAIESAGLIFQSNGAATTTTSISMASLRKARSLSIVQNPSLADLDGLGALDTVVGNVDITNNGLKNLDGLTALTKIGALTVQNNAALTSAASFSTVESAVSITLNNNQLLKSVDFAQLTNLKVNSPNAQSITVSSNSSLDEFKADKLAEVGGSVTLQSNGNAAVNTVLSLAALKTIAGALSVSQNLGAEGLDGFKALSSVGNLTIIGNASLKTTAGLQSLKSVDNLLISQNAKLTAIEGLDKLTQVDGGINISNNEALQVIEIPATTLGESLSVQNNEALTSLTLDSLRVAPASVSISQNGSAGVTTTLSFAALSSVAQQLNITSNAGVEDLDGFGSLLSVGSGFTVQNNAALTEVSGLTKLSTISGSLNFSTNAALTNLNGLSSLTRVTTQIGIVSNALLKDITLPALTSAGAITISTNASLASVKMNALAAAGNGLAINGNGSATTVTATTLNFSALTTIGQTFNVTSNPKLTALTGFPALSGITGTFYFYNNVLLPNCAIVALRNQVQQAGAIQGSITISGNLVDGCATTP